MGMPVVRRGGFVRQIKPRPDNNSYWRTLASRATPAISALEAKVAALQAGVGIADPPGALFGLRLSNNGSDATNDIDFAAGSARDSTDAQNLTLSAAKTKQLDAAWAAGTNAGGRLSAAAIANTTYFCYIIGKADGTTDVGFDTSASSPTLPSGYTVFRRIGAIIRSAGAILAFVQDGDEFSLVTPVIDVNTTDPGTSEVLRTLTVPIGIRVKAKLGVNLSTTVTSVSRVFRVGDPSISSSATKDVVVQTLATAGTYQSRIRLEAFTDTSGRVSTVLSASEAATGIVIATFGWVDTRGRLA